MTDPTTRPVRLGIVDRLCLGLAGPRARPVRAVLAALGIAIGTATVVAVVGIPASSGQALADRLSTLGTNLLTAQASADQGTGDLPPIAEDAPAMVRRIGPVEGATAVANTHATVRRSRHIPADQTSGLTVLAATPDLLPITGTRLSAGTFPDDTTLPTAVLGTRAATRLGITDPTTSPSATIWLADRHFTVVGVLAPAPLAPDLDHAVLISWEAARTWLPFDGHPTVLYIRAAEPHLTAVRSVLPATIYPPNPARIEIARPSDALAAKHIAETAFSGLFLALAAIALLVGGIGVANTMVVSVLERTREIGLRRALGATKAQIRAQFLTESLLLCLLGGLAGIAAGTLAVSIHATTHHWPAVIPPTATTGAALATLTIGTAAGLYPAIRAARLPPTQALSIT